MATKDEIEAAADEPGLQLSSPRGRWVVLAAVLGSGVAFLDSTVVNVALPAIEKDLGGGLSSLQWVLDAYLLTLGGLLLLGGALGDRLGRKKVFVGGLVSFTAASCLCGLALNPTMLIAARALQGVGGALLVPGSLALISASFVPEDRGRAVGAWSGLTGVASAIGPFAGGYLIDSVSWRLVFLINVPLAAAAIAVTLRHVPESRDPEAGGHLDVLGAAATAIGLVGVVFALIEGPRRGWLSPLVLGAAVVGAACLVAFPFIEAHSPQPLVPLRIFRSLQFVGANLTTLVVYGGLGGALFLVVLELQQRLGYSALAAGTALLPLTVLMLLLSSRAGALAQRIGPRIPMTVGPIVVGVGLALMARIGPGSSYVSTVLPAVLVFGLGLAGTVAPLTSAVLGAVEDRHVGVASGVNNAVARVAGLLAVALLPLAAGIDTAGSPAGFDAGFQRAMLVSAVLCMLGGVVAWSTVRRARPGEATTHPAVDHACADPSTRRAERRPAA